jgi:hypothetical protein
MKSLKFQFLITSVLCASCAPITKVERLTPNALNEQVKVASFHLRVVQAESDKDYIATSSFVHYPDPVMCTGKPIQGFAKDKYKTIEVHPKFTARVIVSEPGSKSFTLVMAKAILGNYDACIFNVQFAPKENHFYTIKTKLHGRGSCSTSIFESEKIEGSGKEIDYVVREFNTPWTSEGPWCK